MKNSTLLISILTFVLLFEIIKTQTNPSKNNNTNPTTTIPTSEPTEVLDSSLDGLSSINDIYKPSKAFTAVLMVYMGLIIIGAILVLVLIKPKIEN